MATTPIGKAPRNGNGAKATPEDLEAEIARLREDVARLAAQLATTGEHGYAAARRAASEGVEELRARGEAAVETLRSSAGDVERQVVDAVREKPFTALAIAAGVGYLFALLRR